MKTGARVSRRDALRWGAALAAGTSFLSGIPSSARALGRTPYGGHLRLSLPWSMSALDPHDIGDPLAALFATSISDSLYAVDSRGAVTPALADGPPVSDGAGMIVKLRPGLKTAKGVPLDARDVVASLGRAKARGITPAIMRFGAVDVAPHDAMAVTFSASRITGAAERYALSRSLASPLLAVVPRSFDVRSPDGTGPFSGSFRNGELTLSRNLNAARGASFLDSINVARAADLTESLRAFETERDDIGWLGTGLFNARKDAARFELGRVAWVLLTVSSVLGEHGAPGAAQRLVDQLPRDQLAHLGLGAIPTGKPGVSWDGPPCDLLVDRDAPHLGEVADALSSILSATDHEVTTKRLSRSEIAQKRKRGDPCLSVGIARPLGPSTLETLLSLATFDDPAHAADIAKSPPKLGAEGPRSLTSSLRVAVLGELRVSGASISSLALEPADAGGWDLGSSFIRPKKSAP